MNRLKRLDDWAQKRVPLLFLVWWTIGLLVLRCALVVARAWWLLYALYQAAKHSKTLYRIAKREGIESANVVKGMSLEQDRLREAGLDIGPLQMLKMYDKGTSISAVNQFLRYMARPGGSQHDFLRFAQAAFGDNIKVGFNVPPGLGLPPGDAQVALINFHEKKKVR